MFKSHQTGFFVSYILALGVFFEFTSISFKSVSLSICQNLFYPERPNFDSLLFHQIIVFASKKNQGIKKMKSLIKIPITKIEYLEGVGFRLCFEIFKGIFLFLFFSFRFFFFFYFNRFSFKSTTFNRRRKGHMRLISALSYLML